jgi:undecaprenyl-diphosphatase
MASLREQGLKFWYAAAAVVLMLAGFGVLADEVVEGSTLAFDRAVLLALRVPGNLTDPIGPSWLEEGARDVTALGSVAVLTLLVVVIAGHLMLVGRARTGWFLVGAAVGGTIISTVLKNIFNRPRPDLTGIVRIYTASFPSGHATASAVVYLTIGALLAATVTRWSHKAFYLGVAIFLTLIVGLSRMYLGVHYPSDVLAGWLIGAGWAMGCVLVAKVRA